MLSQLRVVVASAFLTTVKVLPLEECETIVYSSPIVQQHCRDAGFDFFMAKPADPVAIERLLRNHESSNKTELALSLPVEQA